MKRNDEVQCRRCAWWLPEDKAIGTLDRKFICRGCFDKERATASKAPQGSGVAVCSLGRWCEE